MGKPFKFHGQDKFTDYAYLAQGRSLGKNVDILISVDDANVLISPTTVNVFEVNGPNEAAMNLQVTLLPPKTIRVASPLTLARAKELVDSQSASGAQDFTANEIGNSPVVDTPIIAILEWGIGGINVSGVETDISNGLNLNVSASFMRIKVAPDPFLGLLGVDAGSNAIYQLGAFIGPGMATPNNAQRTIRFATVHPDAATNHGTTPIVPIPQFATRVTAAVGFFQEAFVPSTKIGWILQVVFFSEFGSGYAANPDPTNVLQWPTPCGLITIADNASGDRTFPIPAGAKYCAVYNANNFDVSPYLVFSQGF